MTYDRWTRAQINHRGRERTLEDVSEKVNQLVRVGLRYMIKYEYTPEHYLPHIEIGIERALRSHCQRHNSTLQQHGSQT